MNQPKLKRGNKLTIIDTGEEITLDRVQESGDYFCLMKNGSYEVFSPEEVKQATKIKQGIQIKPPVKTSTQKEHDTALNNFFALEAFKIPYCCMECNKPLRAYNQFAKRCVTAHIFAKAHFKSIETNTDNILFLGAALIGVCSCHDNLDRKDSDFRKTMNIYALLLERFEKLKHFMNTEELRRAYTYLGITFK